MSRTITALFDTRADAEAGSERLRAAGIDAAHVAVHDQASHSTSGPNSSHKDKGLWATIKNAFLPDEDRHTYEEGIRRGGFLLTADVDSDDVPAAVRALEEANAIDLDSRSQEWRDAGWAHPATNGVDEDGLDEAILYGERDTDLGGGRFRSYSSPHRDRG